MEVKRSLEINKVITDALNLAKDYSHEKCTPIHVFFILIQGKKTTEILEKMGFDHNEVLERTIEIVQKIPLTKNGTVISSEIQSLLEESDKMASSMNSSVSDVEHLLGVFLKKNKNEIFESILFEDKVKKHNLKQKTSEKDILDLSKFPWLTDLSIRSKNKETEAVIGRGEEQESITQTLLRKKKNNPLLVGDPGVGKTAIVEGIAYSIENDENHLLKEYRVISLDLGSLISGTKFRGEFEERLINTIEMVKRYKNVILFIDEIHTIIGAGSTSGGLDASNILKPELTNGKLKVIGATTHKEFKNYFEKDAALSRRFQKVTIEENTEEDTVKILGSIKKSYERHHKVKIKDESLLKIVELSVKYMKDLRLPDKAIDLLDEACSRAKINKLKEVNADTVQEVICSKLQIPREKIEESDALIYKNLKENLLNKIFGQDNAVNTLVDSIILSKSGIREENKPIGSFLFAGPTGVGKTELTKEVSNLINYNFLRIDMSEYMEKFNISKLIGAPPGYVGFDQEGILGKALSRNPNCVILFDEVEKAHPDIWNILLQILDNGFMQDNYGKSIDFRRSIVVLTTNVGTSSMSQKRISMSSSTDKMDYPVEEIEKTFSPELRNRLDKIIWFNSLEKEEIKKVLNKNIQELRSMLDKKRIKLEISEEVLDALIDQGYDYKMGARPMARLVQEKIKVPLSKEIVFGNLKDGGNVIVSLDDKKELNFEFVEEKILQESL